MFMAIWGRCQTSPLVYLTFLHFFFGFPSVELLCGVSFLATLFLELWKRHKAKHVSQWKVYDWCEEEVQDFL